LVSRCRLDTAARLSPRVSRAEDFGEWYAAVWAAALAENSAHCVLGIIAGFAGVVIDLPGSIPTG
jgi:hypothetical protein